MSTIVYQELQPFCNNESRKTLSLKLNSTMKNSFDNLSSSNNSYSKSNNSGGWSCIEALPSKRDAVSKDEGSVYEHPSVKRSSFMLSEKSLKMCTESLGNETGTFDMESADNLFITKTTTKTTTTTKTMTVAKTVRPRQKFDIRKELSLDQGKFPPPLTTISGTSNLSVRPYREDGRLVIQAISTPVVQPYMQAERSDGRLRLSMLRDDINDDNDNDDEDDNEVEELVENEEEGVVKDVEEEFLEECNKNDGNLLEDMNGISVELGVKLGMGKIQRPSRCKERGQGNKRLVNWEPFWVAT